MEKISPVLTGLLGGFVAFLLLAWAARGKSSSDSPESLRFSSRMRVIAVGLLAIALFIGYAALHASPNQRVLAYAIGAVSVIWATWFILDVFLFEARITADYLELRSPWRAKRTIPWSAIVDYDYSSTNSWHILITDGYGKVRLSEYLIGVDRVLEKLKSVHENAG